MTERHWGIKVNVKQGYFKGFKIRELFSQKHSIRDVR